MRRYRTRLLSPALWLAALLPACAPNAPAPGPSISAATTEERIWVAMRKSFEDRGIPQWIAHTEKILANAERILAVKDQVPGLCDADVLTTRIAATLHDIGKNKDGRDHEELGAELARRILQDAGLGAAMVDRVSLIVGAHHGYRGIVKGRNDSPEWYIIRLADYAQKNYPADRQQMIAATRQAFQAEQARASARLSVPPPSGKQSLTQVGVSPSSASLRA